MNTFDPSDPNSVYYGVKKKHLHRMQKWDKEKKEREKQHQEALTHRFQTNVNEVMYELAMPEWKTYQVP